MKRFSLIVAIILFLCACASEEQKRISELEKKIEEYKQQEAENNRLIADFGAQLDEFSRVQDSLRHYESMVDSLKNEIKKKGNASPEDNKALSNMISQIDIFLAQNRDLANTINTKDYHGKNEKQIISLLLNSLTDKENQIQMMKDEINNLKKQVNNLVVINNTLSDSLTKSKDDVQDQKAIIDKQNSELSALTLSNIAVNFPKGLLGNDRKAKNIDYMDFCFTIKQNDRAEHKIVAVYVRVTDAAGNLLEQSNGKTFYSDDERVYLGYTVMTSVNYQGQTINDRIRWNNGKKNLKSGDYIATFYIDSHKIDQKTFSLK